MKKQWFIRNRIKTTYSIINNAALRSFSYVNSCYLLVSQLLFTPNCFLVKRGFLTVFKQFLSSELHNSPAVQTLADMMHGYLHDSENPSDSMST